MINRQDSAPASKTSLDITVTSAPPITGTSALTVDVNPVDVSNLMPSAPTVTCLVASVTVSQVLGGGSAMSVRRSTGAIPECNVKSVTAILWALRRLSVTAQQAHVCVRT